MDSPLASDSLPPPSPPAAAVDSTPHRSVLQHDAARQQDRHTLSQLKRGNWAAVEDLVHAYEDRLFTTILRMVNHPEDAADLTQETFVRAMQNLSTFEGKSSLYTWLFRIAINLCLTHRRAGRYRRTMPLSVEGSEPSVLFGLAQQTERDPAEDADTHLQHERLLQHLAALPLDLRAILILRDIEEADYDEIGVILNLPAGTVKSRLFRARAALRERCSPAARQEHKATP